jgi:GNAT superfamily N-acetyltransferase
MTIRQAREDDYDAIAAFTEDTWSDRFDGGDYIPEIYHDWIAGDGPGQRTFVYDTGDDIAGLCQCVLLSDHEAWAQGMRVNPAFRGEGTARALSNRYFEWAGEQGATVVRNMVFSWNVAGLGAARSVGYDPATEFRWAHPDPDPDPAIGGRAAELGVIHDPGAAWTCWMRSDARADLQGLALDLDESWALSELTRERVHRAAEETTVFAVQAYESSGTRATAYRVRTYERDEEDGPETWAEYGVGAWDDEAAARALFAAIQRDAASLDADRTRVLIPETPRHVTDAAHVCGAISDHPDFVMEGDLTTV